MGNITTIVVPDAATTPVNHTFTPVKIDGDTAYFEERSATSSLGYWKLSVTQRGPLAGQAEKLYRTSWSLAIPVVATETVNGVDSPKLLYTMRAKGEFLAPAAAVLQNRKDQRKIVTGILADAMLVAMIESQQNLY